jgi:hypothetical protein
MICEVSYSLRQAKAPLSRRGTRLVHASRCGSQDVRTHTALALRRFAIGCVAPVRMVASSTEAAEHRNFMAYLRSATELAAFATTSPQTERRRRNLSQSAVSWLLSHEEPAMTKVPPANFSPELVAIMRSALDTAVDRIDRSHRTPATKAKMAQRIIRTASEGVTDLRTLMNAAVDEGRVPGA